MENPDGAMATPRSPLGSRRTLGAELRRLRTRSGLTLDDVAARMTCSTSKISRLENGKGIPKIPDVRELIRIYGVTSESERETLLRLVHDGRERGWWEPLRDALPHDLVVDLTVRHAALESEALRVSAFEIVFVHGLLQTPDYTRAVLYAGGGARTEEEFERLLELRRRRQEALLRPDSPMLFVLVLDESVLHREVGSPSVMADQLDHLSDMAQRPNVSIRILPFSTGVRGGHGGPFGVMEFPPGSGSDIVYLEGHSGLAHLDAPSDVEHYRAMFGDLLVASRPQDVSKAEIDRFRDIHRARAKDRSA
ncbi:helix-turn-helix domain-containing protein [Pseudonocardia sp. CA-107938]|uniref:helix-turn-helix domain-containing protein n=1 Tax=Pseudonocardia sp. CA-107938 TaxID=3240021 RepID=UPI003D8A548A